MYIAICIGSKEHGYEWFVFSREETLDMLRRRGWMFDPAHSSIVTWHQAAIS